MDQNEVDSDAAEAALSGRLDTLEADPTTQTAVDAVIADLNTEENARLSGDASEASARQAADTTLQSNIDAVQADVNQNEADADAAIAANEVHIDNLVTLTGVVKDGTDLGVFSGVTISDNTVVRTALQELETSLELKATSLNTALTGIPTAPTAAANTNTTQVATTEYVQTEFTDLVNGAPAGLQTSWRHC